MAVRNRSDQLLKLLVLCVVLCNARGSGLKDKTAFCSDVEDNAVVGYAKGLKSRIDSCINNTDVVSFSFGEFCNFSEMSIATSPDLWDLKLCVKVAAAYANIVGDQSQSGLMNRLLDSLETEEKRFVYMMCVIKRKLDLCTDILAWAIASDLLQGQCWMSLREIYLWLMFHQYTGGQLHSKIKVRSKLKREECRTGSQESSMCGGLLPQRVPFLYAPPPLPPPPIPRGGGNLTREGRAKSILNSIMG